MTKEKGGGFQDRHKGVSGSQRGFRIVTKGFQDRHKGVSGSSQRGQGRQGRVLIHVSE